MKYFFALFFGALSFSATSQVWIDQNATWHYDYWGVAEEGFFKMEYNQDSIVGGQNCQMIETYQYAFYTDQFGQLQGGIPSQKANEFTYANGDTVFYWRDNQFFTLFDFGASIGDQWQIGSTNSNGDPVCDDSSFVVVVDTGSVMINSNSYRTISLETTAGSSLRFGGVFVERFGQIGSNYGFRTFPGVETCDTNVVTEYYGFTFKCFEDDSFTLYNPSGEDCEYLLTHLGNEEFKESSIRLYPNPSTDFITVDAKVNGSLEITDNLGRSVFKAAHSNSSSIDIRIYPPGLYYLKLTSNKTAEIKKFIIE